MQNFSKNREWDKQRDSEQDGDSNSEPQVGDRHSESSPGEGGPPHQRESWHVLPSACAGFLMSVLSLKDNLNLGVFVMSFTL